MFLFCVSFGVILLIASVFVLGFLWRYPIVSCVFLRVLFVVMLLLAAVFPLRFLWCYPIDSCFCSAFRLALCYCKLCFPLRFVWRYAIVSFCWSLWSAPWLILSPVKLNNINIKYTNSNEKQAISFRQDPSGDSSWFIRYLISSRSIRRFFMIHQISHFVKIHQEILHDSSDISFRQDPSGDSSWFIRYLISSRSIRRFFMIHQISHFVKIHQEIPHDSTAIS